MNRCAILSRYTWRGMQGLRALRGAAVAAGCILAFLQGGCASPAVDVKVPTMTVPQAWNAAAEADFGDVKAELKPAGAPSAMPSPVISAPDIRMAYITPWRDELGNRHFGSWVAIQVQAPRWVSPDGRLEPSKQR